MQRWERNRSAFHADTLLRDLKEHGIPTEAFDDLVPVTDEVLCGASDGALDAEYPPNDDGLRLILTEPYRDLPALRIAFQVEASGAIVYVGLAPRSPLG